jgi:hypothetical protein
MKLTKKYASVDFEYYDTAQSRLNLVCCSIRHDGETHNYWLHNDQFHEPPRGINTGWVILRENCIRKIKDLDEQGYTFLAYAVTAEARSFLALNLDPLSNNWIDLYLEYRCLSNHNDNYSYGKQLIKGRKKVTKRPAPKWERKTEEDEKKADASKQEYGMGAAVYKTLGKVIDTDFKKEIRDIIIACNSGEDKDIEAMVERKDEIMRYCASDVEHLEPMFIQMIKEYRRLLGKDFNPTRLLKDMAWRAQYAVRTAIMETCGYPIEVNRTRNFSAQVPNILWSCQHDINSQFPFTGDDRIFRNTVKKRPLDLKWNQTKTREILREWMEENGYKNWTLTDGGKSGVKDLSLSLKAFQKPISFRHKYPKGNFIAQMQRYLKLKQGLNGFTTSHKHGAKRFWDSVGQDGRVRPYFGIYGAQSSRSQPSATGFIPLKAAWMRSLISPRRGRSMCGIDYASQEFLLAALLSGDEDMVRAYESGDVYLAFGIAIGYIPGNGTKKTHKKERDNCKAVVLGLSYDMSEYGLAFDLSEKFGRTVSPEEALGWINKHKKAYPKFWKWKAEVQRNYKNKGYIRLADGWYMWGDNDNFRSVGNVPVQGMGACVMRKAVQLAQDSGLDVTYTLHDALYIEFDSGDHVAVETLANCMDTAFRFYFPKELKDRAHCRLDADIWGPDCTEDKYDLSYMAHGKTEELPVKQQTIYIDERSQEDYDQFKVYFEEEDYSKEEF